MNMHALANPSLTEMLVTFKPQIEAALEYAGNHHNFDSVVARVLTGQARFYVNGDSFVITELQHYPQHSIVNVWLAGGNIEEIIDLTEPVARDHAIILNYRLVTLSFTGRPGFARALKAHGWRTTHVRMETLVAFDAEGSD